MLRSGFVVLVAISLGVCLVNGEYPRRPRPPQPRPGEEWGPDGSTPRPQFPDRRKPDGITGPPRHPEGRRPDGITGPPRRPEGRRPEGRRPHGITGPPRRPEGRRPEGRRPEGRRPEGRRPEGITGPPRRPGGRRPDGGRSRSREFPGREIIKHRGYCHSPDRGGCEQFCRPLPYDYFMCLCKRGFSLGEDGKSCVRDGDEGEATWDRPDFIECFFGEDDDDDNSRSDEDGDNSIEGENHRTRDGKLEDVTRKRNLFVGLAVAFGVLVILALVLAVVLCCFCKNRLRRLSRHQRASSAASMTSDPPAYDSIYVCSHNGEVKTATKLKKLPDLEQAEKKLAPANVYVALPLETKAKF